MENKIEEFIKSCLELGSELLEKKELTAKEEKFLNELDLVIKQMNR